jgi:hypothetical protein
MALRSVRVKISQERASTILVPCRATALVFESLDERARGREYVQCIIVGRVVRRYLVAGFYFVCFKVLRCLAQSPGMVRFIT